MKEFNPHYYDILKIPRNASFEEIKKAWRRLTLLTHSDRNQRDVKNADAEMKKINEAYSVLRDPGLRKVGGLKLASIQWDGYEGKSLRGTKRFLPFLRLLSISKTGW